MPTENQKSPRWISQGQATTSSKPLKVWKRPKLKNGKLSKWLWVVRGLEDFKMGERVDIGAFTYIQAEKGVEIGDDVQIGSPCSIYSVSTIDDKGGQVILKKNCKIGTHSTIMPNITIGENSIIGAYSFVTKNIPDNVIAFGIPCKIWKSLYSK